MNYYEVLPGVAVQLVPLTEFVTNRISERKNSKSRKQKTKHPFKSTSTSTSTSSESKHFSGCQYKLYSPVVQYCTGTGNDTGTVLY
jgi:hypothetical protein